MGPDGRIYWSVADKGINATGKNGEHFFYPDRGGIKAVRLGPPDLRLRNGQEPVFDEFGNLFTSDNEIDYPGERERFIHIVEGGMTAWRLHWQWHGYQDFAKVSGEKPYKFIKEGLFRPIWTGSLYRSASRQLFSIPGFAYDPKHRPQR